MNFYCGVSTKNAVGHNTRHAQFIKQPPSHAPCMEDALLLLKKTTRPLLNISESPRLALTK